MNSLPGIIVKEALKNPDNVAIEFNEKKVTYDELVNMMTHVASFFIEKGFYNEKIIILHDKDESVIVNILGVLYSGNIFIPIHSEWPVRQLESILSNTKAKYIITQEKYLDKIKMLSSDLDEDIHILLWNEEGNFHERGIIIENIHVTKAYRNVRASEKYNDICYIYHTSGSTSEAKEILGSQESILHFIEWEKKEFSINQQSRISMLTSLTFDAVLRDIFAPLLSGGTLCIPEKDIVYDSYQLIKWLDDKKITLTHMVPSLFREMIRSVESNIVLMNLKYILMAGEPLNGNDLENCIRCFGNRIQLVNLYGASETCMIRFFYRIQKEDAECSQIPVGYPLPDTEGYILNNKMERCKPGEIGEIYVKTRFSTYGYYNNSNLNVKNFVSLEGNRAIYKTGDLGYFREDGCLICLGRLDNQVKIRGMKVNMSEVEETINSFPGIYMSAVIMKSMVNGEKVLVAYYVTRDVIQEELYGYLYSTLPNHMVPAFLIRKDSLPKLVNGKLNRKALEEIEDVQDDIQIDKPYSEVQRKLAEIWSEVLSLSRVGVNQDFFQLGGHSLKASRLAHRINQEFNITIKIIDIFRYRTIYTQEEYIRKSAASVSVTIPHANPQKEFEASEVQRRIYLASISIENTVYNMPSAFHIAGKLNVEKMKKVMQTIVERHESLRTNLRFSGNRIVQKIRESVEVPFEYKEINAEIEIDELITSCIKKFNLEKDVLLRSCLFHVKEEEYILFWDMHHCISDGISEEIIKEEWAKLYNNRKLNEVVYQYKDYSAWCEGMEDTQRKDALSYWIRELNGGIFKLELPVDYKCKKDREFYGSNVRVKVDEKLYHQIVMVSKREDVTLYSVLLSAFYILLFQYTRQEDITIGTVGSGREKAEFYKTVGAFITTIALRNYPKAEKEVLSFIHQVSEKSVEMLEYANYSFEELINELAIARNGTRLPLIEVMFILQNMDLASTELDGLEVQPVYVNRGISKYDLTLYTYQEKDGLLFDMEYSSELFNQKTIEKILDGYLNILRVIASIDNKEFKIGQIPLLSSQVMNLLLQKCNGTLKAIERITIHEKFENSVKRNKDKIAIRCKGKEITYADLNRRANRIAHKLISNGVAQGEIVGIILHRSIDMIAAIFAVLKTGCAYLPIDPGYPERRIKYMLEHSKCKMLITDEDDVAYVPVLSVYDNSIDEMSGENLGLDISQDNLAYVIYTSGSTGKPKGVMLEHRNEVNFIEAMCKEVDFSINRKILCLTTVSFDIFVLETMIPLSQGMEVILADEEEQLDLRRIGALIEKYNVEMMQITPSRLEMFMEDKRACHYLKGIQTFLVGGETVKESTIQKLKDIGEEIDVFDVYGPTETCVWSTIKKIEFDQPITIGHAIKNTRIYILDQQLNLLPDGVAGDLYIGGLGVARGYLHNEELTAERFIVNPFIEGERIYNTGDKARWNCEGEIEFLGRDDNQVKVRGYRIELSEIEECILKNREVYNCICVVKQDANKEGNYILAYYYSEKELDKANLLLQVKKDLPFYMIPRDFIYLDNLPLTPNGKVDRRAVSQLEFMEEVKEEGQEETEIKFDNEEQEFVYTVWLEVLGRRHVGLDDNFFDIGGNSMFLVRSYYLIDEKYPDILTQAGLFANPTIRMIAKQLCKRTHTRVNKTRMHIIGGLNKVGGYHPFIQTHVIKEKHLKLMLELCKKTKLEIEEVMFSIFAYLGAKISGERNVFIQCLISKEEGIECHVNLETIKDFNELLKNVACIYREKIDKYKMLEVEEEEKEDEIFLSYTFNQNIEFDYLKMLDLCLCVNASNDEVSYKIVTNKNKLKQEFSEKVFKTFTEIIFSVITNT